MKTDEVLGILDKHEGDRGGLISVLEDIQAKYSYLPAQALKIVAQKTGRSLVDIYGVATFYKSFSLKPRGKHLCSVCVGTACHVRGAPTVERTSTEKALPSADSSAALRAAEEETSKYTGLCVNCENRRTCAHPKPAGGVWHCEDYC